MGRNGWGARKRSYRFATPAERPFPYKHDVAPALQDALRSRCGGSASSLKSAHRCGSPLLDPQRRRAYDSFRRRPVGRLWVYGVLENLPVAEYRLACPSCGKRHRAHDYAPDKKKYQCKRCGGPLELESGQSVPEETESTAPDDPLIGKQIGQYKVLDKLGEGGMGTVYKVVHLGLRRFSALKVLPEHLVERLPRAVERFMREARSAAALSHPNIVTVFNVDEVDGYHFIDMEYVDGENVHERFMKQGRLSIEESTQIVMDTAKALGAAHAKNIIHRDVKPANILLDEEEGVKVADFGLAKNVADDTEVTSDGERIMGTAYYMSPEQCEGQEIDHRADIYALGVTYFFLVTGELPFKGTSTLSVMLKHKTEPVPDARSIVPDVPASVLRVIEKSMAKEPGERYQSCGEMVADLELAQEEIKRGPVPPAPMPVPPTSPSPVRVVVPASEPEAKASETQEWEAKSLRGALAMLSRQAGQSPAKWGGIAAAMVALAVIVCVVVVQTTNTHGDQSGLGGQHAAGTSGLGVMHFSERGVLQGQPPPGFEVAFMLPPGERDQYGNPVVERKGSRYEKKTMVAYEVWLREPRMEFVLVSGGTNPATGVLIGEPFYMGKYEVRQSQYKAVLDANPSHFKKWRFMALPTHPIEGGGFEGANAFCARLAELTGVPVRLPTEAEWEYTCRGGKDTAYCFGDDEASLPQYAWYRDNSGNRTQPVGQKEPNYWGFHDMHGNVWEWCSNKILRGGAWCDEAGRLVTGPAGRASPVVGGGVEGFRCVLILPSDTRAALAGSGDEKGGGIAKPKEAW